MDGELMRRLIALFFCVATCVSAQMNQAIAVNTPHPFAKIQSPSNVTCSGNISPSSQTCVVTATATTSGHGLLALLSARIVESTGSNPTQPAFVSMTGDSAWTHCSAGLIGAANNPANAWQVTDCAYITSSTGGATTFTWTESFAGFTTGGYSMDVTLIEFSKSNGAIIFDTGNSTSSSACTSCGGPAITLTGTSEYIFDWMSSSGGTAISISGAQYTTPFITDLSNVEGAFAGAINQSSAPVNTWTSTPSGMVAMSRIAFK
jgi:hypothetical protein